MTKNSVFARNLKRIMYERQILQVDIANQLGVSKPTVSGWCSGQYMPRGELMQRLLQLLDVSLEELTGSPQSPAKGDVIRVPILGRIPAGVPLIMIQDVEGWEEIAWRPGEFFALRIRGSSMEPRIKDGDVVILKKQEDVENGEVAAVVVGGDDATLKKVYKQEGTIVLMPLNPSFTPMVFPASAVRIIGKAVELRAVL